MQFRFSNETAEFIVFRFVPDGRDKRAQIKGDKTVVARDAVLFDDDWQ